MKATRLVILALAACMAIPMTSSSIPAFARKYGFNCNMCHTAFTKLNDFGQRLRDDGYQLPGQEGLEKNVFETPPPIAVRGSVGLISSHTMKANTSDFSLVGLDLLAAGVLHKNVSFLMVYTPRIDEPAADYTGSHDGSNPSQLGALEAASVIFSNLVPELVNLRVGKFEPAYHTFSSKRSFYLQQPYEIYNFVTPGNDFVFDDNQMGIEVTGGLRSGFRYAGGVVNGSGANPDNSSAKDLYARLAQIIGRGEGQSAGQRIGVFGYLGWRPISPGDTILGPTGASNGKGNKSFYRIGADVSLNWRTFNLYGMFVQGSDDKALDPLDSTKNYEYTGGFAELD